jgi:hypothetical protein
MYAPQGVMPCTTNLLDLGIFRFQIGWTRLYRPAGSSKAQSGNYVSKS